MTITDCIQWISDRRLYGDVHSVTSVAANLEDSSRAELNPTQIFIVLNDHVKNEHVLTV